MRTKARNREVSPSLIPSPRPRTSWSGSSPARPGEGGISEAFALEIPGKRPARERSQGRREKCLGRKDCGRTGILGLDFWGWEDDGLVAHPDRGG